MVSRGTTPQLLPAPAPIWHSSRWSPQHCQAWSNIVKQIQKQIDGHHEPSELQLQTSKLVIIAPKTRLHVKDTEKICNIILAQ